MEPEPDPLDPQEPQEPLDPQDRAGVGGLVSTMDPGPDPQYGAGVGGVVGPQHGAGVGGVVGPQHGAGLGGVVGPWLGPWLGPHGKHYVCGSIAAFTNIVVTFPLQKVLFRQQLHGVTAREAVSQLRGDGVRRLYRGLLPPLLQKSTTVAIMFGLYEDFSRVLLERAAASGGAVPELVTRSFAAAAAGTAEAALTPFERVQTLLQDHRHHGRFNNTAHTFRTLLSEHGVSELYRGLVPVLLRNGPSNILFFGLRGPIKDHLPAPRGQAGHLTVDFVCGGVLGAFLGIMFYPLNVVKSQCQAQVGGAFRPCGEVLGAVWAERGRSLSRLFRGAHLNWHRSLLSWGIINATYEMLLKVM